MKTSPAIAFLVISLLFLGGEGAAQDVDGEGLEFKTVEERRLQSSIVEERASLRREREELDLQKMELKTLEEGVDKKLAEMDRKLAELKEQQARLEALLADKTAEEQQRIKGLAAIYEKMQPAKAALAISGLERQLAADLLAGMKVKAAAKILDQISKQKAAELSTAYTTIQLE